MCDSTHIDLPVIELEKYMCEALYICLHVKELGTIYVVTFAHRGLPICDRAS